VKGKLQIPNPKLQTNSNIQTPNSNGNYEVGDKLLKIGPWSFFGAWCLEIRAFKNVRS
jgi:hypothetical protein